MIVPGMEVHCKLTFPDCLLNHHCLRLVSGVATSNYSSCLGLVQSSLAEWHPKGFMNVRMRQPHLTSSNQYNHLNIHSIILATRHDFID